MSGRLTSRLKNSPKRKEESTRTKLRVVDALSRETEALPGTRGWQIQRSQIKTACPRQSVRTRSSLKEGNKTPDSRFSKSVSVMNRFSREQHGICLNRLGSRDTSSGTECGGWNNSVRPHRAAVSCQAGRPIVNDEYDQINGFCLHYSGDPVRDLSFLLPEMVARRLGTAFVA
jgi:hypothetical protein